MKIYFIAIFLLCFICLKAQVSGVVKDTNNEPLPSVSIVLKNSYLGTSTNLNGEFSLKQLPKGEQTLIIKSIGFRTEAKKLYIDNSPIYLNVTLQPEQNTIDEVVVNVSENPANRIIRQAIAHRKINSDKNDKYHADFYSKGIMRIKNLPKKIAFTEIGDEISGLLDSSRSGIIYLSETTSKISFQKPNKLYEHIVASKVSGDDRGFSFNTAIGTNFDFYSEHVDLSTAIISPISGSAFSYYTYKLIDSHQEDNHVIHKIQVLPKRDKEPVVEGFLYIVDDSWEIYAVDFYISGYRMQQPIIDKLHLVQHYNYNAKDARWTKSLQTIDFNLGLLGINMNGRYTHNFSDYTFVDHFEKGTFGSTISKIDEKANLKDSTFWASMRPMPLTDEEIKDYVQKDSIQAFRTSKEYLDSIDSKQNKFKPLDIIVGYHYQNSHKELQFEYKGLSNIFATGFNPVQGWNFTATVGAKFGRPQIGRYTNVSTLFQYGLADKKLRITGNLLHRFNTRNLAVLSIEGGNKVVQFNENGGIKPLINMVSALFFKENFMQVYQKRFITVAYAQNISVPLRIFVNSSYINRGPLFNHTDYAFVKRDKPYVSNNPLLPQDNETAAFEEHNLLKLGVALQWSPGMKAIERPDAKVLLNEGKMPTIIVGYQHHIGINEEKYSHQILFSQMTQNISFGNVGIMHSRLNTGKIFNGNDISFTDYKHFNGNLTHVGTTANYTNEFLNMPYYANSTNDAYLEFHVEHNFKGFLTNRIPGLNALQWNLILGYHHLATTQHQPYHEMTAGFDNIGWGKFRMLRFDFVRSLQGNRATNGFVVGLKFLNILN